MTAYRNFSIVAIKNTELPRSTAENAIEVSCQRDGMMMRVVFDTGYTHLSMKEAKEWIASKEYQAVVSDGAKEYQQIDKNVSPPPSGPSGSPLESPPSSWVNHPHYYGGDTPYEVSKVISEWEQRNKNLNWHIWTVVKYIPRAGLKNANKLIEDLEKAKWYLEKGIELLKRKPNK